MSYVCGYKNKSVRHVMRVVCCSSNLVSASLSGTLHGSLVCRCWAAGSECVEWHCVCARARLSEISETVHRCGIVVIINAAPPFETIDTYTTATPPLKLTINSSTISRPTRSLLPPGVPLTVSLYHDSHHGGSALLAFSRRYFEFGGAAQAPSLPSPERS